MLMYKVVVCFVLVSCYPIHLAVTNPATAAKQEYQEKGVTSLIHAWTFRICVWLFVFWYLYLYLKYCYGYYVQCKILYSPSWSAEVEKMGRCVCLAPELTYTDSSHHHVTSESANQTPEILASTESLPQKPILQLVPYIPFKALDVSFKGVTRLHGVMNLALAQRQRSDFIGPRSPLVPLMLTDLKLVPRNNLIR